MVATRVLFLAALLMFLAVFVMACGGSVAVVPAKINIAKKIVEIIGAVVEEGGSVATVLAEKDVLDEEAEFHLVRTDSDGRLIHDIFITKYNDMRQYYHVFLVEGKAVLAWNESGRGVCFAFITNSGEVDIQTILPVEGEGEIGDFWLLRVAGQYKLFVVRRRDIQAEGQVPGMIQWHWLYSYNLGKGGPELSGKVCLEEGTAREDQLVCASADDEVIVWQILRELGGEISMNFNINTNMVRCAKWSNTGRLEWHGRYVGNASLKLRVDASCGTSSMITEWKSPEDGSGIICCVLVDKTNVIPIGVTSRGMRFSRIASRRLWGLAQVDSEGVLLTVFRDDFTWVGAKRVDEKNVTDCALVDSPTQSYLVLMQQDSLSIRKLYWDMLYH